MIDRGKEGHINLLRVGEKRVQAGAKNNRSPSRTTASSLRNIADGNGTTDCIDYRRKHRGGRHFVYGRSDGGGESGCASARFLDDLGHLARERSGEGRPTRPFGALKHDARGVRALGIGYNGREALSTRHGGPNGRGGVGVRIARAEGRGADKDAGTPPERFGSA